MCDPSLRMAPSSNTLRKKHLPKAAVPEMLARFGKLQQQQRYFNPAVAPLRNMSK
ncbi:hypothetical protein PO909_018782 [Leuciscus waleckii]